MPSRSSLREYHLLIVRLQEGYAWQIRYNRHAKPVQNSTGLFGTHQEAERAGSEALAELKAALVTKG